MSSDPLSAFISGMEDLVRWVAETVKPVIANILKETQVKEGTKPKAGMESTLQERPAGSHNSPPEYVFREWAVDRTRPDQRPQKGMFDIKECEP